MNAGRPLSVTARLILLFSLLSSAVLLALGWAVSVAIERHFVELDHHALSGKVELARELVSRVDDAAALERVDEPLADAFVGHHDLVIQLADGDGRLRYRSAAITFPPALTALPRDDRQLPTVEWQSEGRRFRGVSARIAPAIPGAAPLTVAVAIDVGHHDDFIAAFQRSLALYVLLAALLMALAAWWATRRGLAPLRLIRSRAAAVTASRLGERLPAEAVPAELAELVGELNAMLARLEDAFQRLSQFSSDLAHELRTPIANLMMQTQVALSQPRDSATYRDILASNAEEFERLSLMISDMLFLAKADHGLVLPNAEALALEDEIAGLFEFFDALAEDRGVALVARGAGRIAGDRLMVRRALSNLLSNALRYTPRGGTVRVSIEIAGGAVVVTVANPGPPIPEQELGRIFERFHRVDPARAHGAGAGLGLAITQAIVAAHRGSIHARSEAGETAFVLRFPAVAPGLATD
jgi:two-component system heavy metal sensor histidine kinase CusS